MKGRKLFFGMIIACLLLVGSLIKLAGRAEAAPVPLSEHTQHLTVANIGDGPRHAARVQTTLPGEIPPQSPLLAFTPVLTLTKSAQPDPVVAGDVLTYTIVVENGGDSDATGSLITDTLPGQVNFISASDGGIHAGGVVTWNVGTIATDTTVTRLITASVPSDVISGTTLSNTAEVTTTQGITDKVSISTDVNQEVDLAVTKSNGQNKTVPGEETTYTITVTNNGPSDVTGATVTDNFPADLTAVTWTCSPAGGASCTASGSGDINDSVDIPAGDSVTYSATGTVDPGARGTLANTASATVPSGTTDPVSENNSAIDTDNLTPKADVGVAKSDSPDPVIAGNILTYNITVTNNGPSDATQVKLTDNLPAGVVFQSSTPGSPTCTESGGSVICNFGTLAKGGSIPVTIQVRVDSSLTSSGLINIAQVERLEQDDNSSNDLASASTTVEIETDLAISKSDSADPVSLGNQFTYILEVVNNGPSDATGVEVTDNLPAEVTPVSANSTKGSCSGSSTITCDIGNLVKDGTATITIVVAPQQTGSNVSNSANVTGNEADPVPGNNLDDEQTTFNKRTDLVVTKSDTPDPVFPGDDLTYNITVTNNGPSAASGVVVTDILPGSGISFDSATPSQGSGCSGTSTVVCNLGNLASGNSAQVTIVVNVASGTSGTISNSASVSGNETDPDDQNNSVTANTQVGQFQKTYLPLITKPAPTILSIQNDNTGGNVTVIVRTLAGQEVTQCTVPNNQTQLCDHNGDDSHIFPPGTYTIEVSSNCGSATTEKAYSSGPVTTRIFCK